MREKTDRKRKPRINFWFVCLLAISFCCITFVEASPEEYQGTSSGTEKYDQSYFTFKVAGDNLNVSEIQKKSDFLVDTFIERYQTTLQRNGYARPTPLLNPDNQSLTGFGMTIQPDGLVSTISIYRSEKDNSDTSNDLTASYIKSSNQDRHKIDLDAKIDAWITDQKSIIMQKSSGYITATPNAIGNAYDEKEYRDWGTVHFVSDYYADLTSSDSLAYFYVKTEVINIPGIYFHNKGTTGWNRLSKSKHYLLTNDWNWVWGNNPTIPNGVIRSHQPMNNPHNQEFDADLRWPPSAGLSIHIKAPETGIVDAPVSLTKNQWDMNIRRATFDTDCNIGLTTNYGTEIETQKSSLTKDTTYSLAVVSMDNSEGFWDYLDGSTGPKSDEFQTILYGNYAYTYTG